MFIYLIMFLLIYVLIGMINLEVWKIFHISTLSSTDRKWLCFQRHGLDMQIHRHRLNAVLLWFIFNPLVYIFVFRDERKEN